MTAAQSVGRVLRLRIAPRRDVISAERVKSRGIPGGGYWRLKLSCNHTVLPLKLVENIAEAAPPGAAQCWKCLSPASARPVPEAPWRDVVIMDLRTDDGGSWRLTLSCGHVVTLAKVITNVKGTVYPKRFQCWECAADEARRPTP